jgi:hypothetical protein
VPWRAFLSEPDLAAVADARQRILRLLFGLPAGIEIAVPELAATVAADLEGSGEPRRGAPVNQADAPVGQEGSGEPRRGAPVGQAEGTAGAGVDRLPRALAAAFLEPLVALGVAELDPPPPRPPARLRLGPAATTVIGSALVAAGEEVPLGWHTLN